MNCFFQVSPTWESLHQSFKEILFHERIPNHSWTLRGWRKRQCRLKFQKNSYSVKYKTLELYLQRLGNYTKNSNVTHCVKLLGGAFIWSAPYEKRRWNQLKVRNKQKYSQCYEKWNKTDTVNEQNLVKFVQEKKFRCEEFRHKKGTKIANLCR